MKRTAAFLFFCCLAFNWLNYCQDSEQNQNAEQGKEGNISTDHGTAVPSEINRFSPLTLGIQKKWHDWDFTIYGFANFIYDHQGGCWNKSKFFSSNAFIVLAAHELAGGKFIFRSFSSLESGTIGFCGYPLFFAERGICKCVQRVVDYYPPRDLIVELAASYEKNLTKNSLYFVYFGLPGVPALGPLPQQRVTSFYIPQGSITHPFFDSTRTNYGVATLGYRYDKVQLEVSQFTRRRPFIHLWGYQKPHFDSTAVRLSLYPNKHITAQFSYGDLHKICAVVPFPRVKRLTASVSASYLWNKSYWQTTFCWGQDTADVSNGKPTPLQAMLLESSLNLCKKHIFYGRWEQVFDNTHLQFDLRDNTTIAVPPFRFDKITGGYTYQFNTHHHLRWAAGFSVDRTFVPTRLQHIYGRKPISYYLLIRVELL